MNKNQIKMIYNKVILMNIDFQTNNQMTIYKYLILLNTWIILKNKLRKKKQIARKKRL
jgi:hypothetical protein